MSDRASPQAISPGKRLRKEKGELFVGLAWISPWLVGFLLFMAIPVVMSVYYGFTEYSLIESPVFVGLENYREMASDALFWKSLTNTLYYAFASVILGAFVAIGIALLLEQKLKGTGLVRALVFVPTLVPIVAASLGWMWLYNTEQGLFNNLLSYVEFTAPEWLGGHTWFKGPDWLGNAHWAMPSLIIMSLWMVGSAVVIYTAALRAVPAAMYESAEVDGVGPIARFLHITLPMISPAVLFNVIMSIIWSLQVFAVPYVMTRFEQHDATSVYSFYVYRNAFEYGRMGYASSLAWIQFLIALALTAITIFASKKFVFYRAA